MLKKMVINMSPAKIVDTIAVILESMELGVELTGSELWNWRAEVGNRELMQPEPDLELGSEGHSGKWNRLMRGGSQQNRR